MSMMLDRILRAAALALAVPCLSYGSAVEEFEWDVAMFRDDPELMERVRHLSGVPPFSPGAATSAASPAVVPAQGAASAGAPDPALRLVDAYVFPNPARRGERPTIRLQVGQADLVEVRIYDVSGRLVHGATVEKVQVVDDGNGKGPQYTYDYAWDPAGVGSGVYTFVAMARQGKREIRKAGKLAILK